MATVEQRLDKLEADVAELRRQSAGDKKKEWLSKVAGSFRDDPEFAEIVKLGREIREADRPKGDE